MSRDLRNPSGYQWQPSRTLTPEERDTRTTQIAQKAASGRIVQAALKRQPDFLLSTAQIEAIADGAWECGE